MAPHYILLPGKSHGRKSLVGCRPWGREESDTTERLHFHFSLSCIGEGNGNPLQCSCLQNPRDRGAWWATVYGVTQSRTWLKRLSSSSSSSSSIQWVHAASLSLPGPLPSWSVGVKQEEVILAGVTSLPTTPPCHIHTHGSWQFKNEGWHSKTVLKHHSKKSKSLSIITFRVAMVGFIILSIHSYWGHCES